ncbi:MAG: hypothetical protein KDC90_15910, partial [Ignavibacteriae bacterium]|nr:hypothetical protein [Ignavibacteriota bacterium]
MNKYYHFERNTKHSKLLAEIVNISIESLGEMYLPVQKEFAMMKKKMGKTISIEGRNTRYTLINLLGLHKANSHGIKSYIDLKKIVKEQIEKVNTYEGIGELGLLIWAISLISPEDSLKLLTKIDFNNALNQFNDAKAGYTMELSWFLTGLLFASTFNEKFKGSVETLPPKIYAKIRKNYGGHGIFQHEDTNNLEGKIRANIGSFADQVYSIYALSLYSQQYHNEEALLITTECANKICELQSENGEWQWQYDSQTGKVVSYFPIHTVHQVALAPMALFAAQMASGNNYNKFILKGINWLTENKFLQNQLIDKSNNAILNKITPVLNSKLYSFINLLGIELKPNINKLKINYESSSYDFGWILYTFAGRINYSSNEQQEEA